MDKKTTAHEIAIIGGGPAGLMAAEILAGAGQAVTVFDAMPTLARKFLLAGKSGLNITHAEPHEALVTRYGAANAFLHPALDAFTADNVRQWAESLGSTTFVGSSGRVFPEAMKASPLLRAWLQRLTGQGVTIRPRHRWLGLEGDALVFDTPDGRKTFAFDATLLALGGASYPRLGSDAAFVPWLTDKGVEIAPFQPANCGFDADWSPIFAERFAGQPVKAVTATSDAGAMAGEFVVGSAGIEGSLVYAHAAALRDRLAREGRADLVLDLVPGRTLERLTRDLARFDAKTSFANRLRKGAGIEGVKAGLVREILGPAAGSDVQALARALKALPIPVLRPRPIAEAISSAGGIRLAGVDERFMLKALPGIFVAGEMLDWEAPTGGYLLTACLATGRAAGQGVLEWLAGR